MADHEKEKFSAKKLNEILEIPWPYLRQLLTKLSKSGFIFSTQGRNGGFQLQKPANKIILADIIEAVEGLEVLNTCIMGFNKCPFNHTCAMHEVWEETRNSILKVLNNTSLDHLKKGGNKG
jgi:Rrf2 family transcriptional regulator, nitric oxide-sensitive transcriptional repressor